MKRPLLLLLVAVATAASSAVVDITWDTQSRFAHRSSIAPGKFVELCGALAAGAQVRWRYEAGAPVDFNIHYHVSKKDVVYPAQLKQTAKAADTLSAAVAQDYCWMWTNKGGQPVPLAVELERL